MKWNIRTEYESFEIYKKEDFYFLLKDNSFYELGKISVFREYMMSYFTIHRYDNLSVNGKLIRTEEELLEHFAKK